MSVRSARRSWKTASEQDSSWEREPTDDREPSLHVEMHVLGRPLHSSLETSSRRECGLCALPCTGRVCVVYVAPPPVQDHGEGKSSFTKGRKCKGYTWSSSKVGRVDYCCAPCLSSYFVCEGMDGGVLMRRDVQYSG